MTQTTDEMLAARGRTHGEFTHHAAVAQAIKRAMHDSPNWLKLPDIMKETLEMNAHKIARVLTGNPFTADHWQDMIGYDRLILQRTQDGVGMLEKYADVVRQYPGDLGLFVTTDVGAQTESKVVFTTQECANRERAALVIHVDSLAAAVRAGHRYKNFYQAVAVRAGVTRKVAQAACEELGYDKNGKRMRGRVRG